MYTYIYICVSISLSLYIYMKVDYGESRHFCDDPVCPEPVWKLSVNQRPEDGS